MNKGKNLPQSALDWYDFHFPQSPFHGQIQVSYIGKLGFRQLWSGERENLRNFLKNMNVLSKSHYYITANTCTNHQRSLERLFSLENIVIDIDCHQEGVTPQEIPILCDAFLTRLQEYDQAIPTPHSIVRTGRGLQLWWKLVPLHSKCKPYYNQVKDYFISALDHIIQEYPSELSLLSVDQVASRNPVGLFRLPGTRNPKARKMVELTRTSQEDPYILQDLVALAKDDPLEIQDKLQEKIPEKFRHPKISSPDPFAQNYQKSDLDLLQEAKSFTFFRCRQLIQLRYLRDAKPGEEQRNNFSLLMYSALRASFPHGEAWNRLLMFNQGFQCPMTTKELENTIVTAQYKEGYQFTNATVISFLQVTPQEQEKISLFPVTQKGNKPEAGSSHPARDAQRKIRRDLRNTTILSLFRQGKKNCQIAAQMKLSPKTVGKITRSLREQQKRSLEETIKAQLHRPMSLLQEELNLSHSTLYRHRATALIDI